MKSKVNIKYEITDIRWVISLINTSDNPAFDIGHSAILIEGMKNGQLYIRIADVILDGNSNFLKVRFDDDNDFHNQKYLYEPFYNGYAFYVQPHLVERMIEDIQQEIKEYTNGKKIHFQRVQLFNIKDEESHNCTSWAKEKLKIAGIDIIGKNKPKFPLFFAKKPAQVASSEATAPTPISISQSTATHSIQNDALTVRFWAGTTVGHTSLQTFQGGGNGQGIYVSFWPGVNVSDNDYCKSCNHHSSHWHTLENDLMAEHGEPDLEITLTSLNIDKINQKYLTFVQKNLVWDTCANTTGLSETNQETCSGICAKLLIEGGINDLFLAPVEQQDMIPYRFFRSTYFRATFAHYYATMQIPYGLWQDPRFLGNFFVGFCQNYKPLDVIRVSIKAFKAEQFYLYSTHPPKIKIVNSRFQENAQFSYEKTIIGNTLKEVDEKLDRISSVMPQFGYEHTFNRVFYSQHDVFSYLQKGFNKANGDFISVHSAFKDDSEFNSARMIWEFTRITNNILKLNIIRKIEQILVNAKKEINYEHVKALSEKYMKYVVDFDSYHIVLDSIESNASAISSLLNISDYAIPIRKKTLFFDLPNLEATIRATAVLFQDHPKESFRARKVLGCLEVFDAETDPVRIFCLAEAMLKKGQLFSTLFGESFFNHLVQGNVLTEDAKIRIRFVTSQADKRVLLTFLLQEEMCFLLGKAMQWEPYMFRSHRASMLISDWNALEVKAMDHYSRTGPILDLLRPSERFPCSVS